MATKFARSVWFAVLVSLLVALGTQSLIENLLPVDVYALFSDQPAGSHTMYRMGQGSEWPVSAVMRLISFALGAFVGGLLVLSLARRFVIALLVVVVLATVFQQFPLSVGMLGAVLWAVSGFVGAIGGLVLVRAYRGGA